MEAYLDDSNMRYSDYISNWTCRESISNSVEPTNPIPINAMTIDWKGELWNVFSGEGIAPDITIKSGALEDYHFLVAVTDSGVRHAVRPIRDSELLRMYGFSEEFQPKILDMGQRQKSMLFLSTIPKHSLTRIISVIQVAEQAAKEQELESHGRAVGELGQKRDPCRKS